ncbi:hypothetical protein [Rhodocyclus tenuis]|uniref:Uncharacterized protein n=1 Tax=Rhodocyclus tenuis TaxID=1066 RepID=A0A840GJV7_RHOTE|nr:hypothetical protein [Rhodocyclus tenuis]MBB4248722.1 hypothetical protein [Rhodocyclus tenuis]
MKRRRAAYPCPLPLAARQPAPVGAAFITGLVTQGLLLSLQGRGMQPRLDRRTARMALQGGAALAAGTSAAHAWQAGAPLHALTSVATGVAAVAAIEYLLQDENSREKQDGQEEA